MKCKALLLCSWMLPSLTSISFTVFTCLRQSKLADVTCSFRAKEIVQTKVEIKCAVIVIAATRRSRLGAKIVQNKNRGQFARPGPLLRRRSADSKVKEKKKGRARGRRCNERE